MPPSQRVDTLQAQGLVVLVLSCSFLMDSRNCIGLKLLMRLVRFSLIRSFERSGLSRIQLEPSELNCFAMVLLAPMSHLIKHCETKQVSFTQKTTYYTQYTSSRAHALSLSVSLSQSHSARYDRDGKDGVDKQKTVQMDART